MSGIDKFDCTATVHVECRRYFEEPNIPCTADALDWWEEKCSCYPLLAGIAVKYLCIPGTSVPSEWLFSKAGELISHRRSALTPEHVNMILFLNKCA